MLMTVPIDMNSFTGKSIRHRRPTLKALLYVKQSTHLPYTA